MVMRGFSGWLAVRALLVQQAEPVVPVGGRSEPRVGQERVDRGRGEAVDEPAAPGVAESGESLLLACRRVCRREHWARARGWEVWGAGVAWRLMLALDCAWYYSAT